MNLYAESSAVLSWLLGEPDGADVARHLREATRIVASEITVLECHRVLVRAVTQSELSEAKASKLRAMLERAQAHWTLFQVSEAVLSRARRPFPVEPIRTLDALHLATALTAREALGDLALLTRDDRVRRAGHALGFDLRPMD